MIRRVLGIRHGTIRDPDGQLLKIDELGTDVPVKPISESVVVWAQCYGKTYVLIANITFFNCDHVVFQTRGR